MADKDKDKPKAKGLSMKDVKDVGNLYIDSAKKLYGEELPGVASELGSLAVNKAKEFGSGVAKEARNYGRLYKEGLGMKPDTPYEKKKGGKVSSASKRADGIVQRGKTRGRMR